MLFNWIQVRTVWRQIKDICSSVMQQIIYRLDMVGPEIVHYHDIPWTEGGIRTSFRYVRNLYPVVPLWKVV